MWKQSSTYLSLDSPQDALHQYIGPWQDLWCTALVHPSSGEFLQISRFLRHLLCVDFRQDIVDVHMDSGGRDIATKCSSSPESAYLPIHMSGVG